MTEPKTYVLELRTVAHWRTGEPLERWTLNGWEGDEPNGPSYLDTPNATLEQAQRWACVVIWRDSHRSIKVAGWDGNTPRLLHIEHRLEVHTAYSNEPIVVYAEDGFDAERKLVGLADQHCVWQFPGAAGAVYIPVRNITRVRHECRPTEQPL